MLLLIRCKVRNNLLNIGCLLSVFMHKQIFFLKNIPKRLQVQKKVVPLHRFWKRALPEGSFGEMAEWSIAAVLKTVVLRGTGGSNPSLSAINAENQQIIKQTPNFTPKNVKLGVFILFKTNHIRSENNLIKNS